MKKYSDYQKDKNKEDKNTKDKNNGVFNAFVYKNDNNKYEIGPIQCNLLFAGLVHTTENVDKKTKYLEDIRNDIVHTVNDFLKIEDS